MLSDHMDYDYPQVSNYDFVFDPEAYFKKLEEIKEHYDKKIEISTGIELGLQPHLAERLTSLIHSYPLLF